jgi:hypothetical protein
MDNKQCFQPFYAHLSVARNKGDTCPRVAPIAEPPGLGLHLTGGCGTWPAVQGRSYVELADSSAGRSGREVRGLHPEECRQRAEYGEGCHD